MDKRLVIGMSGASGAPLTVELLQQLRKNHPEVESHLIVTKGAELTLTQETDVCLKEQRRLVLDEASAALAEPAQKCTYSEENHELRSTDL